MPSVLQTTSRNQYAPILGDKKDTAARRTRNPAVVGCNQPKVSSQLPRRVGSPANNRRTRSARQTNQVLPPQKILAQ